MTVETEVATLTTAVDNLTSAVNVSKATLDAKVVNAQSAETGAIAASGTASGFSTAAAAHKDQAYTYSQSAASAVAYQDLTAIAATKSVTAVDVFVYDTSKDSDGGAWRKRSQGTSWYNEALNTATRGSRKEFPAVAVIVADSGRITIHDGDDPSMPMWMVFNIHGSLNMLGEGVFTCIYMLNGSLGAGSGGVGYDLNVANLISDNAVQYSTASVADIYNGNIAQRNSYRGYTITGRTGDIVNRKINDVAMTVLPNAPIDSATGLPIPTIAVATDGGVSVIKDDGSVVSGGTNNASWLVRSIGIDSNNTIWANEGTNYGAFQLMSTAPYTTVNALGMGSLGYPHTKSINNNGYGATSAWPALLGGVNPNMCDFASSKRYIYTGFGGGVTHLVDNVADRTKSMVAYTASDYNTGYMVGDIKLAALSDTDDTDVTDAELVTNGTFASNTTGWITNDSTLSVVSGKLLITGVGGGGGYAGAWQILSCVVGQQYSMSWDFVAGTHECHVDISGATGTGLNSLFGGTGSYSIVFTATSATPTLKMYVNGTAANNTGTYDNISVRLADTDRSVNANGLQVHGTITKNPVASGSDLVGYSGFSSSNYLEQPYNSDLDFGTGDFSVMGWIKPTGGYDDGYIFQRGDAGTAGGLIALRRGYGGGGFPRLHWGSTGFDYDSIFNKKVPDDVWSFIVVMRSGNTIQTFVNAEGSGANTSSTNVSNTNGKLRMGLRMDTVGQAIQGSLALWRISATAPSAKQIKDIYEAEKPLFQAGAQATLYGTSDAVTALAHDDTTNLLHVGTPSGRSVFQGLRRVDNTTSAVGSAISASNNLVVED